MRKGKSTPAPKTPLKAQARGLWQGQEPESLRVHSYAERRVLRLGRVYAAIKRVMVNDAPWSGGEMSPHCQSIQPTMSSHTYQDPDFAVRTLCLLPNGLCEDLYVQVEGSDPSKIVSETIAPGGPCAR